MLFTFISGCVISQDLLAKSEQITQPCCLNRRSVLSSRHARRVKSDLCGNLSLQVTRLLSIFHNMCFNDCVRDHRTRDYKLPQRSVVLHKGLQDFRIISSFVFKVPRTTGAVQPAETSHAYFENDFKFITTYPIFRDVDCINSKLVQISKLLIKIRSENPCVGVRIDSRSLKHEVRSYLVFYSRHAIYSLILSYHSSLITFS